MPLVSLLSSVVPQLSLPSLLQSLTSSGGSASKVMQARPATVKRDQRFFLTILTNRIKKCSGCGLAFRNNTENGTVPDYILGHIERDWYPNNGEWQLGKQQNKYYHLQKSCILQRCPLYCFPADFSNLYLSPILTTVPLTIKEVFSREFGL